ncbi:hypothetical protein L2E82_09872 [Cichorium intybus]|uniref:Uncharacterized protein n=1 Tax=Cichorium intybus TaxID=13427 RepID=A0ACB9GBB7_CICIN|nr:hypothetical protein L2E82_09872 [Cichorium intybus]
MVGIDREIIEHGLSIQPGSAPVKQKKRGQAGERNDAINKEVTKMVQAGILREAIFPTWIANPVMVKKSDGSWRMCIDYKDLNKACPNDSYPLPEIDQKIESLHGFRWKCFLDAYKGYHQILMKKDDEEKTAFYTDNNVLLPKYAFWIEECRRHIPTAGRPGVRPQIGWNIEVYVDDMVIKSRSGLDLIEDIRETLATLEKIKMKLNPSKMYLRRRRGAVPRDMQGLNGKLTALGRFVAKSAERAVPLFETLKGDVKKGGFKWTPDADKAWQRLKKVLTTLPTPSSPTAGETLVMYLSTSREAISAVLVTERGGRQSPIYFTVEVVLPSPQNRSKDEPAAKANNVKPKTSGRLAKWAILGEHDIEYRPRVSIKGQALADFLLEVPETEGRQCNAITTPEKENTAWKLHTDGAAGKEGCGVGIILQSPQNEEMTYALRFDFQTSNNEAEYEALISGLRLAASSRVKDLEVLSDSMLVTSHVNRTYEARDPRMKRYVEMVSNTAKAFNSFTIRQIPRLENRRADVLSKLASTSFDHLTKKVLVEVLKERSIEETHVNEIANETTAWMTLIIEYIKHGILPEDETQAIRIRIKAPQYSMMDGKLYKKGYLVPWLKCITSREGQELLQEAHAGDAGAHEGARALTGRILRMGVYWPEIQQDAVELTRKCVACQTFAPIQSLPSAPANEHNSRLAIPPMGNRHTGPFPRSAGKSKIPGCGSRLFYKIDRGRTRGQHIREVNNQIHVEIHPHTIRHAKNPNQQQRPPVRGKPFQGMVR